MFQLRTSNVIDYKCLVDSKPRFLLFCVSLVFSAILDLFYNLSELVSIDVRNNQVK